MTFTWYSTKIDKYFFKVESCIYQCIWILTLANILIIIIN
jgi:hypothetical protein